MKNHKKAAGDAQTATRVRDTTWDVLRNWMGELRATAQVAFRETPEQARKLDF